MDVCIEGKKTNPVVPGLVANRWSNHPFDGVCGLGGASILEHTQQGDV